MGCAAFSRKENFSRRFAAGAAAPGGRRYSYNAETQYTPSSKPSSFSAFLQSIVVDKDCQFLVEPDGAAAATPSAPQAPRRRDGPDIPRPTQSRQISPSVCLAMTGRGLPSSSMAT